MTPAARSLQVFGIYLLVLAVGLVLAPNALLALFGMPPTQEVWIRVLGLLVGIVGAYDVIMATRSLSSLYMPTVVARAIAFVLLSAFALLQIGPPQLALFAVIDLLGALWTWRALRAEPRA
jgi:hypothetical protein